MATHVELYNALVPHVGREAAQMIADAVPPAANIATKEDVHAVKDDLHAVKDDLHAVIQAVKDDLHAVKDDLHAVIQAVKDDLHAVKDDLHAVIHAVKDDLHTASAEIQTVRADVFKWGLAAVLPIWIAVWGTLVAQLVQGR